jgi:hypothetical protein
LVASRRAFLDIRTRAVDCLPVLLQRRRRHLQALDNFGLLAGGRQIFVGANHVTRGADTGIGLRRARHHHQGGGKSLVEALLSD